MPRPVRSMYMDIVEQRALGGHLYRVTIAANEKVRQPPELDFDGISTENYANNPVVMWAHDSVGRSPSGGLPIGRTLSLDQKPNGRIVADFEFLSDDPFAQRVKNAWDKGFLQAASISWIPLESVPVEGGGRRDTKADLLEWSIVSVPADPEALRKSHRRLLDAFLSVPAVATDGSGGTYARAGGELVLTPDDYDDLTAALALLRDVVDGVEQARKPRAVATTRDGARSGLTDEDMTEIQVLLQSIKGEVMSPLLSHSE